MIPAKNKVPIKPQRNMRPIACMFVIFQGDSHPKKKLACIGLVAPSNPKILRIVNINVPIISEYRTVDRINPEKILDNVADVFP